MAAAVEAAPPSTPEELDGGAVTAGGPRLAVAGWAAPEIDPLGTADWKPRPVTGGPEARSMSAGAEEDTGGFAALLGGLCWRWLPGRLALDVTKGDIGDLGLAAAPCTGRWRWIGSGGGLKVKAGCAAAAACRACS